MGVAISSAVVLKTEPFGTSSVSDAWSWTVQRREAHQKKRLQWAIAVLEVNSGTLNLE